MGVDLILAALLAGCYLMAAHERRRQRIAAAERERVRRLLAELRAVQGPRPLPVGRVRIVRQPYDWKESQ